MGSEQTILIHTRSVWRVVPGIIFCVDHSNQPPNTINSFNTSTLINNTMKIQGKFAEREDFLGTGGLSPRCNSETGADRLGCATEFRKRINYSEI